MAVEQASDGEIKALSRALSVFGERVGVSPADVSALVFEATSREVSALVLATSDQEGAALHLLRAHLARGVPLAAAARAIAVESFAMTTEEARACARLIARVVGTGTDDPDAGEAFDEERRSDDAVLEYDDEEDEDDDDVA